MRLVAGFAAAIVTTAVALGATTPPSVIVKETSLLCGTLTWDHPSTSTVDASMLQLALVNHNGDVVAVATPTSTPCATRMTSPSSPSLPAGLVRTNLYVAFNAQTIQNSNVTVKAVALPGQAAPFTVQCSYQKRALTCRMTSPAIVALPSQSQVDLYVSSTPAALLPPPVAHILSATIPEASAAAPTAPPIYYATDQVPAPSASAPPSPPAFFQNDRQAITIAGCTPISNPLAGDGCFMSYGKVDENNDATSLSLPALASDLRAAGATRVVVLLHGFNSDFAGTLDQARALRDYIRQQPGSDGSTVVMIYAWPAKAADFVFPKDLLKYTDDETNNTWAALHLRDFLAALLDADPSLSVDLVAHSMGNRLMLDSALALREQSYASAAGQANCPPAAVAGNYCGRIGQIVGIEPDVDMETFAEAALRLSGFANGVTLYGHTKDYALLGSEKLHGHCRAGQLYCDGVFPTPTFSNGDWWLNVVDATLIMKCDPLFHHSYWPLSTTVLRDLAALIVGDGVMSSSAPRKNIQYVAGAVDGGSVSFPHYRIASLDPDDAKCLP
ncbi:MAG: alpha/beta hydrolase [Candidatus Baltobacteraceae bacterium]